MNGIPPAQSNAFKFANNILTNGGFDAADLVGAAGGPTAGQVIQVLSATDSTARTTTSATFVTASNTLSVAITPASASNKVAIFIATGWYDNGSGGTTYLTIFRDSTNLAGSTGMVSMALSGMQTGCNIMFLDSPNTTSAITYQLYMRCGAGTSIVNGQASVGSIICMEVKG
jgi:hypothetical protein